MTHFNAGKVNSTDISFLAEQSFINHRKIRHFPILPKSACGFKRDPHLSLHNKDMKTSKTPEDNCTQNSNSAAEKYGT